MSEVDAYVKWITHELLRYCGPIFVAPGLNSYPEHMVGCGTYGLIDTGQKRLLATCCHVWDQYQEQHDTNQETVLAVSLGEGDSNIAFKNPERQLIVANRDLDLVTFEFEPRGIGVRHTKSWFKISEWPIGEVMKGEYLVTLGFPGAWRETTGTECIFKCTAIPLAVTDTNDRTIGAFCGSENQDVLNDMKDSLGGISGSPAYRLTDNGELRLVGFAKRGPLESNALNRRYQAAPGAPLSAVFFTHASFLQQDGTFGF